MKLQKCVKRFMALIVDMFILSMVNVFLLILVILATKMGNVQPFSESYKDTVWPLIINYLYPVTCFAITILYFIIMETKYNATLGKMAFKIRLYMENQKKIGLARVFLRLLLMVVTSFAGIGLIFYLLNSKNQFLHDWLTKTYVE